MKSNGCIATIKETRGRKICHTLNGKASCGRTKSHTRKSCLLWDAKSAGSSVVKAEWWEGRADH